MVDIPETHQYRITKQPNAAEETDQVYGITARNIELAPSINSGTDIICGDLLRCLCWCCCLAVNDPDSKCNCCSDSCCDCNCDCGDCSNCDC